MNEFLIICFILLTISAFFVVLKNFKAKEELPDSPTFYSVFEECIYNSLKDNKISNSTAADLILLDIGNEISYEATKI